MSEQEAVAAYLSRHDQWAKQLAPLRAICASRDMQETIKWGAPTYCMDGSHIVSLAAFKQYCGLWFHQGALLSDPAGVLVNAQTGKTRAMRQWRLTADEEVDQTLVNQYLDEAIKNHHDGRVIKPQPANQTPVPPELAALLRCDEILRENFARMTTGQRREFNQHIQDAKGADTRQRRLDKIIPMIHQGIGLNDKYRRSDR